MQFQVVRTNKAPALVGESHSSYYEKAANGLLPSPIKIGGRASIVPLCELELINAARIAGKTNDEIRVLVAKMAAQRKSLA